MKRVLTGDRPSGKLHLGHFVGSLQNRVLLQETHEQYIMVADLQMLTDHFDRAENIQNNIIEVVLDYLSVGIDPSKSTIFVQSHIPELCELTIYYLNLVHLGRLIRNPTVKTELKQKGFEKEIPVGFLCYPISQASDITAFKAQIVPVGQDQLPLIEQTNEIVRRFNRIYQTDILIEVEALLGQTPKLVGIDGKEKAGKSLGNAIFLTDRDVKEKVFSMFTDPSHIRITDPGKVEGNVVFSYLDAFHPNPLEVKELKDRYKKGGLGDTTIKGILNQVLNDFLKPLQDQRASFNKKTVLEILEDGKNKARPIVIQTLNQVKEAIGIGRC